MAENIPNPTPGGPSLPGGPPKKAETGKVQPKKETVRISLPPKPTAAPTIKLPTLPAGGPSPAIAAPSAPKAAPAAPAAPAAAAAPAARPGPTPSSTGTRPPGGLTSTATRPAAPPAAAPRSAPAPAAPAPRGPSAVDVGLAVAAAVVALGAVVSVVLLMQLK